MDNNVQFYPSKIRYVPNFKLSKIISNLDKRKYESMVIDGKNRKFFEKKNHKKHGNIITSYKLINSDGFDNTDPLDEFDRDVLSVCGTEFDAGNSVITPSIIYRALTGKIGEVSLYPSKNQRDAIMFSIQKLMSTIIEVDLSEANLLLNYNGGKQQFLTAPILPCKFVTTTVNGQVVDDVIHFLDESPIFKIAKDRKQILSFDATLLDVTNQNNTPTIIAAKNYVMCRVAEIKAHKQLQRIITFDDLFRKCRIDSSSRKTKMDVRNVVVKFFEHLQTKGAIKNFEITKKRNNFYSVNFQF